MPDGPTPLGRRLRAARAAAGLTQSAVAATLGVSPSAINQVESGHREPSRPWLLWAALKLGWRPSDLAPDLAFADPDGVRLTLEFRDGGYRPATAADARKLAALGWKTRGAIDATRLADVVRLAGRVPVYLTARPEA
jgi:transcriptional regulator with XRE-family HTH domain